MWMWKFGMAVVAGMVCCAATMLWAENAATQPATTEPKAPPVPTKMYYIDEETGEESLQPMDAIPPLLNKNGKPMLVRAIYMRCSVCGGEKKLMFLEKFTPEGKIAMEKLRADSKATDQDYLAVRMRGYLVKSPEKGSRWVLAESEPGWKITEFKCPIHGGDFPQIMLPK